MTRILEWTYPIIATIAYLQAAFAVVGSIMILAHYWDDKRYRHIMRVASATIIFVFLVSQSLVHGLYMQPGLWYRLPLSMLGFYLLDHGLYNIFEKTRDRIEREREEN